MAGDVTIKNSQIISGSQVSHSQISNVTSETTTAMTPEMWDTVFRLVDTYGKPREIEDARALEAMIARGDHREAQPIWHRLRGFLSDFANVSKIVEVMDRLMR